MGIRKTLNSFVSRPMEGAIRELIEEVLASRSFVRPGELSGLRQEVADLRTQSGPDLEPRIQALEDRLASVQQTLEATRAALVKAQAAPAAKAKPTPAADRGCKVPGCEGKHRARGFCAKHYQMLRRSTLPAFVGPDGQIPFDDGSTWQVEASYVGEQAVLEQGSILIGGQPVEATLATS